MISKERQKIYDEINKGYEENAKAEIICGRCNYHYSKYLTKCPQCAENEAVENESRNSWKSKKKR